jgi:hypothetical protein
MKPHTSHSLLTLTCERVFFVGDLNASGTH